VREKVPPALKLWWEGEASLEEILERAEMPSPIFLASVRKSMKREELGRFLEGRFVTSVPKRLKRRRFAETAHRRWSLRRLDKTLAASVGYPHPRVFCMIIKRKGLWEEGFVWLSKQKGYKIRTEVGKSRWCGRNTKNISTRGLACQYFYGLGNSKSAENGSDAGE